MLEWGSPQPVVQKINTPRVVTNPEQKSLFPCKRAGQGVRCLPLPSQAGKNFNLNKTRRALAPEGYKYEHWTLWVDSGPAGPSRLNLFGASGVSDGAADHGGSASEVPAGV